MRVRVCVVVVIVVCMGVDVEVAVDVGVCVCVSLFWGELMVWWTCIRDGNYGMYVSACVSKDGVVVCARVCVYLGVVVVVCVRVVVDPPGLFTVVVMVNVMLSETVG